MKTHHSFSRAFFATLLSGVLLALISADRVRAQAPSPAKHATTVPAVDPATHAAHVALSTNPATPAPDAPLNTAALAQQFSELQAKVAQLEAALAKSAPHPLGAATSPAGAMPGMAPSAGPMAGMRGAPGAMKPAGGMNMMEMMSMMDKMMSMGGASGGMEGGGMGMMQSEMAGMMGMGAMSSSAPGTMLQSALPGFPGASHLYHIGATGFFLDHPQHIALTTEQQVGVNQIKEQVLLAKNTADRAVEKAEQELWILTAADQPDATAIEAKVAEIGKLTGNARLAFIRAVGDASKLLTDEQRKTLTGFAPPAPTNSMTAPAATMPAGGMQDM